MNNYLILKNALDQFCSKVESGEYQIHRGYLELKEALELVKESEME